MRKLIYLLVPFFLLFLTSCEEEIEIDVDISEPKVVIEGWITTDPGPYEFTLTRSQQVFDEADPEVITGATVIITQNELIVDTLVEVEPGKYHTTKIEGVLKDSYSFEAIIGEDIITSHSVLPRINHIDTITATYINQPPFFEEGYYITFWAQELPGMGDFYLCRIYKNDSLYDGPNDLLFFDDELADGQYVPFTYPFGVEIGDKVEVEIFSVTEEAYEFLTSLQSELNSSGNPFGAPPQNLAGNYTNDGLGFFHCAGVARMSMIVEE